MCYRFVKTALLLLGYTIVCLFGGCSNSEWADLPNEEDSIAEWEYPIIVQDTEEDFHKSNEPTLIEINNEQKTEISLEKYEKDCFNNYRLPNLKSRPCKEKFLALDTVIDFPKSGFFPKAFTIVIPEGKSTRCEIGGKKPTKESPLTSVVQIDSSITIRCIDFSTTAKSEIIRTYILEKAPDIATVFITTDPNSLFDPDTGIYMEGPNAEEKEPHYGANYWLDKEIPVFVELVEPGATTPGFAKHAGLKIFGNYSRANAKKSVAITFREKYNQKRLYYPLFPEFPELRVFKGFILRNFGNSFGYDYIRDRLASSLSEGLNVDYQRGRFAIVYYNGKYFGIHDLRERSNEYYFETHYGFSHDNINLLKADNSASAGSAKDYIALMDWLKTHSLDNDSNYAYISSKIDIDNFINYMHTEIFANNLDWPGNNLKKWNSPNIQDQWKWFLYDLDFGFGYAPYTQNNIFDYVLSETGDNWKNAPAHTLLLRKLIKNNNFKIKFISQMETLIQTNFKASMITAKINQLMEEIEPEIPRDQKQWSLSATKMEYHLKKIIGFAEQRQAIIINNLREHFKID